MTINLTIPDIREMKPRITVFGVGGAGGNAVNNMIAAGLQGVDFVVAGKRLVARRRDEIAVGHRARVQAGRDEAGEVRHVAHQERADLVCDLAEAVGLDCAWIRGAAAHDQLRLHLLRAREHLVVVDLHRLARDAVVVELVELPGEVDLQPVRQVAAVVEREAEHAVARLEDREVDGHVGLRARVRLHVRVLGAEQLLRARARELLDLVDDLAASVVALARIPLGVLVRRHRPDRLEHRRPREVLGRDQLDLPALPVELAAEQLGDLRIDVVQTRRAELVEASAGRRPRGDPMPATGGGLPSPGPRLREGSSARRV